MKAFTARLLARISLITTEALVVGVLLWAAVVVFFYLTRVVFVNKSATFDWWAFSTMDTLRFAYPGLTSVVLVVTFFASMPFLLTVGILAPAGLLWRGYKREAWELLWAVAGGAILNQLLKIHYERLRPDTALLPQAGLSFPSGHAMIGMTLYGCVAWLLWRHGHHPAWAAALLLWTVLIGLSRVYLHVHYATDVVAGFAAGLVWLILLRFALHLWEQIVGVTIKDEVEVTEGE
ncbi:phosphatase PAP2 family protein [Hymenobacter sp. DG25A]|uniref:phosphatase PAP2 family protein n=1 Tax=Hymenobacter sp. DG25A TaxID=1385663 RepID=UPI0006C8B68E|nr:phosphatase PAP2 family protein [Hymenobacter sp. DG25A]